MGRKRVNSLNNEANRERPTKQRLFQTDVTSFTESETILQAQHFNAHLTPCFTVHALEYNPENEKLCVLKRMGYSSDANKSAARVLTYIEFYNASSPPLLFLEKNIPIFDSLEAIIWTGNFVAIGNLSGQLYFFSCNNNKFKRIQAGASEIIAMDKLDNKQIVVANNSREVILMDTSGDKEELDTHEKIPEFQVSKTINFPEDKPIICLACKKHPKTIAVGMVNGLSLLTFSDGKLKRSDVAIPHIKTNAVVIWSLCFVDDNLFVGDSNGQVTIYSAENGSTLKIFKTHQAPVLTLASDGRDVYAAGTDYRIQIISSILQKKKRFDWQQTGQRLFHSNDVRTMCMVGKSWLISGGYDNDFYISSKNSHCNPLIRSECSYSSKKHILLTPHLTYFDIWHIPQTTTCSKMNGSSFFLPIEKPRRLLRVMSGSAGFIKQISITPNGRFICIAGNLQGAIKVFQLHPDFSNKILGNSGVDQDEKSELIKLYWTNLKHQQGGGNAMFCTDKCLYYATGECSVFCLDFDTKKLNQIPNKVNGEQITRICTNPTETHLIALTTKPSILNFEINRAVYNSSAEPTNLQLSQFAYDCFFLDDNVLLLLTSDLKSHLICYDLVNSKKSICSNAKLGLLANEWISYVSISSNCLLATTNKDRVAMLEIEEELEIKISLNGLNDAKASERSTDIRREPFWMKRDSAQSDGLDKNILLFVGHEPIVSKKQKPAKLKFYGKN